MADIQAFTEVQGFTSEQIQQLEQPLDASLIHHRKGSGSKMLAYLKGASEIEAANRIFGFGKWSYRVVNRSLEKSYDLEGNVTGYFYTVDVELLVVGAAFPFPGDGVAPVTAMTPDAHESARKAASTDALKRALRHYGNAFGLPLYDEDALVDIGDGVLAAVKEVKPNSNGNQGKRVIESGNAPKQLAAAPDLKARLKAIIERAKTLGVASSNEEWQAMLQYLEIAKIQGIAEIDLIESYLSGVEEKQKEAAGTSGK